MNPETEGAARRDWPLGKLLIVLAALAVLAVGLLMVPGLFRGDEHSAGNLADQAAPPPDSPSFDEQQALAQCASPGVDGAIKRTLFDNAARLRGRDAATFARLADYVLLNGNDARVAQPEGVGRIACSARMQVTLPPGLETGIGERSFFGTMAWRIDVSQGTPRLISVDGADTLIVPLSTLRRSGRAPVAPAPVPVPTPLPQVEPLPAPDVPTQAPAPPPPPAPPPADTPAPRAATPSFSCADARSTVELAICAEPRLAALDRLMASQYRAGLASATPPQRDLLLNSARRFLQARDRCPDNRCIDRVYRGRLQEIGDIVNDRWRGR